MTTLGAVFRPQNPPERLRDVVRAADETGLDELWLWEDCFLEGGISTAAAALAWSERVRIGVGVLPVPLRNVAVTAMEIATLERMFPGRGIWGVGHGVQEWMEQVGARAASPVTLLREYLDALRGLLDGQRITVKGSYVQLDDVALDWPPTTAPPILAAAKGPKTMRLVGESADGMVLDNSASAERIRAAADIVAAARSESLAAQPYPIVVYLLAATGPGAADRVAAELRAKERDAIPDLGVAGDARAIADTVIRWTEAGATSVVLQPTGDEPDPVGFVRFVAEQVGPLLP
ncbi:LLM class flavin-dependent oxidoreductase [Nocardia seriolae]|uniref:5,10-methylenetetrahydromethanopterin reductase n=1 Tax=Nocardia seriolae TaxID=37332 RepID=A0A0B8NA84_9NOCA|nr:LLM class flavin-dependent oxidoreductase [Nocardia seriolae]APA99630.1 5,10-methylenetetrahydromethanopterin reductase [Nocardia seriolae]MTJ64200.1 LLM class flavin-dependent oxidoreductase [Nocardia seriolae]MTJ73919.1 LLM class flavin-dependent oxidoreductase [Nocardia seriolae]MTJ89193.1 LLM class flavin-dependent oxidoreductase [Nocardia seriolae]MTK33171.1 LLM class flavin-dependent oxidoreductase [Nocardia seriolae]